MSYVFSIAEFITDKENRLLKRVSEVGSQLGLQQRGKHKVMAGAQADFGVLNP